MSTAQLVATAFVVATLVAPGAVVGQNNAGPGNAAPGNAAPGGAAQSNSQPLPATAPAPSGAPVDNKANSQANNQADTSSDRPTLQDRYPRYLVTRSDVLALSFPLSPEFNRNVTVQPDGYINLQGTKSVYVQGMTVPQIIAAIKKAYEHVLRDPIVDVDLVDFQKPYFIAGGQVSKPGQYELRHDTTVSQAIAMAGGISSGGKTQIFLYHQARPGLMEVKKLNLKDIYHGKNVDEDALLQPGDTLFVPEKMITMFRKYVPYAVGTAFNPQTAFQ